MKESHIEGLATHNGPESCIHNRKGMYGAMAGVHAGRVLSRETKANRVPTLFKQAEGNTNICKMASI